MRASKIKALIKLVEESKIDELEISQWGRKIRIRKNIISNANNNGHRPQVETSAPDNLIKVASSDSSAESTAIIETPERDNLLEIKTPMVGTFYRAPAPDAKPYVKEGDRITRGQTVCIIEAMKIMNEIESEYDGVVAEILVQDTQPVQFGQILIYIKPA